MDLTKYSSQRRNTSQFFTGNLLEVNVHKLLQASNFVEIAQRTFCIMIFDREWEPAPQRPSVEGQSSKNKVGV